MPNIDTESQYISHHCTDMHRYFESPELIVMFIQFLEQEDDAQVIKYAFFIAVISIVFVLALQTSTIAASFGGVIDLVSTFMKTGPCI